MDSYGCPLCCQQKFNSIVALKEHLVYFTFRPLLCVLCRMNIGGIFELIQHLETHLITEKNSTADVLRNIRYMDDENCLPDVEVDYDVCNTRKDVSENVIISDLYQKISNSQPEGLIETTINAVTNLSSESNAYITEIGTCNKITNSNVLVDNRKNLIKQQHVDRDYVSISSANSELFCSESNSENLSICSLSENESLSDDRDTNMVNYAESDEVRAYACHECGVKIVGKDFYFSHLQEHANKSLSKGIVDKSLSEEQLTDHTDVKLKEVLNLNREDNLLHTQVNSNPGADFENDARNLRNNNNTLISEKNIGNSSKEIRLIGHESSGNYGYSTSSKLMRTSDENKISSETSEERLSESNAAVNISKTGSSSMQHYIHKKFDHDQERKFEGLSSNSDVQCYIQNFQSLLVNKLNQAFENNEMKLLPASNTDMLDQEESPTNDSPQVEVMKSNGKYHCRYCTKPFVWKQTRDTHELNRKCSTVNICKHCNKEFEKNNSLSRHEQEMHANEVFFCNVCGRHFKSLRYLSNHKGVHDKKRFTCSKCPSSFHTSSGLRSHIHESHSLSQKGKEMVCEHCGEKFKRKYGLQRHIERKHSLIKFSCRYCKKEFPCKEDLGSHMIIHLQRESLCCNICDMIFTSHSSLKRHKETHKNVSKSNQCKICSAFFTRKDSLICHMQTQHSRNLKYICKCGKAFNKASHLKYHEVKHSKTPPQFRCEICQKTFKYKISLKKHKCKDKKI